ncbi:integrase core domain-containing protein [Streptomyces bobili]|uniref:integrase core domain-containing protein n=1 Tax=Streptomyces bobili TaxID=67280 RepID=UPI0033A4AE7D
MLVHAPDGLRHETAGKTQIALARHLAALRPRQLEGPADALRHALRTLARRWRVGSCFDNAVSQTFNSVLKVEYVHRQTFRTRTEARIKIATWITDFYNTRRLHGVIDYEREYRTTLAEGLAA